MEPACLTAVLALLCMQHIRLLGFVPRDEVVVLYSCFDLVLFTSFFESFGIVNLVGTRSRPMLW